MAEVTINVKSWELGDMEVSRDTPGRYQDNPRADIAILLVAVVERINEAYQLHLTIKEEDSGSN